MPRASVVIATYNRAERLAACLASLTEQRTARPGFEVVVVVDGSTDETRSLLESLTMPVPLRIVWQRNQGQCAALNRGAAEASGDLLVFIDDDITVVPGFIGAHLALFDYEPNAVGVGQMLLRPAPGSDWFGIAFAESWRRHYARLNAHPETVTWRDCFGGNMSVSRERFQAVGGFATGLARGYDVELAARLEDAGGRFVYLPNATGLQDERKDFRALLRDAELGGQGAVAIFQRRPEGLSLIGHFPEQTPQSAIALRTLLRLALPPAILARLLWLAPRIGQAQRCFDLLHRYAFWRGVKAGLADLRAWEQLSYGVVILMYHGFCRPGERETRYLVSESRFRSQMRWLKRRGWSVIGLEEYVAARRANRLPPPRSVVISIDDGYVDVVTTAAPVLQESGFTATVFLPTGRAGGVNDWSPGTELLGRRLLGWSGVRELEARGISFGAHGRSHVSLAELPPDEVWEQIEGSRADMERELGKKPEAFSYPYGELRPGLPELLKAAGFAAGVSVDPGPNTPLVDLFALRRVEVWGQDSLLAFAYALATGRELRAARRRVRKVIGQAAGALLRRLKRPRLFGRRGSAVLTEKH
jgi:GT2 family glycosyltransferase/peptidoglycan/xylan/chitin deacetylase (PgdA/CDA1 family)